MDRPAGRGRIALPVVLGLGLAGCAAEPVDDVGPLLEGAWPRPEPAVAAAPGEEPADVPDAPAPAGPERWTLDAILARIAAANPTVGEAQARVEEARAARREAVAAWYPELSLGLDYLSTDSPSRAFALLLDQERLTLGPGFDATPGTTENWRKELRVDWPLFAPGRRQGQRAAEAGEQAARLAAQAVERRLLNAGVQAWIGLGAARALDEVARESVSVVEERLERTRARQREGAALTADVLRLEVRLAAARQEAARSAHAVRVAESGLNHLMGREPAAPLEPADDLPAIGVGLPETLEELEQRAAEERRDVQAAAERVRMLGYQRAAERAQHLPTVSLFGAYDIDGEDLAIDGDLDSTTVGIGLRLPLSARTAARTDRARASERAAREALRALALDAAREVSDAWEALAVSHETLALAESAVGAAEEAYRLVAVAHDAGAATATDVLEAEDARRQARVRVVAARAGLSLARARLAGATGGVR